MRKIMGWDEAPAYTDGVERVPAGGHICRTQRSRRWETAVKSCRSRSKSTNPLDGIFQRTFVSKHAGNPDAKWPCVFNQFLTDREGVCSPYFKGLIRCVENSNSGYQWAWNEETLKGKRLGMIFREEEFVASDGSVRTTTRPAFARSVDMIREGVKVPEIKRLPGHASHPAQTADGFAEVSDEELPF